MFEKDLSSACRFVVGLSAHVRDHAYIDLLAT